MPARAGLPTHHPLHLRRDLLTLSTRTTPMGMRLDRCLRVKFPSRVASKADSEGNGMRRHEVTIAHDRSNFLTHRFDSRREHMATTSPPTSVSRWSQARGADDSLVCTARNSQRLEPRDPNRHNEAKASESHVSLQRALCTLRAVRQRYETGRNAHPDARSYSVNVVVDHGDVAWITAAIEALEQAIAAGPAEAAGPAAEARPET
jgi:hypothetical protein